MGHHLRVQNSDTDEIEVEVGRFALADERSSRAYSRFCSPGMLTLSYDEDPPGMGIEIAWENPVVVIKPDSRGTIYITGEGPRGKVIAPGTSLVAIVELKDRRSGEGWVLLARTVAPEPPLDSAKD
jgi:hypothetical protein